MIIEKYHMESSLLKDYNLSVLNKIGAGSESAGIPEREEEVL